MGRRTALLPPSPLWALLPPHVLHTGGGRAADPGGGALGPAVHYNSGGGGPFEPV